MKKIISIFACICLLITAIIVPVSAENSATISFANTSNRTEFDSSCQVWKQNGITVTNNKASSGSNVADYVNPVRFYASSEVVIEYPSMTKIVITASSSTYANVWEKSNSDSKATVTVSGSTATIVFSNAVNSYTIKSLTAQTRVNSITVYSNGDIGGGTITPTVPEMPSDPMEIVDAAFELEEGEYLPYTATLEGEVSYIEEEYSAYYDNISVYILVEGTEYYYEMFCYRLKAAVGEDASKLDVGDIIEVTGKIKNHEGLIEFDSGSTYVTVYKAPDYSDEGDGTAENPFFVELLETESDPTVYEAEAYLDFYEDDEPFFIKTIAPESGLIGVNYYASDYYGNNVGYTYDIQNITTNAPIQSVTKAADDDVYNHYELVYVNKGDEIVIGASTYDALNPSVAPEAEIGLYMCFYPIGSIECPDVIQHTGKYTADIIEASQGRYYTWVVPADGTVTIEMGNDIGWQYRVSKAPTDIDEYSAYYYSDRHCFDDDSVIASEIIDVLAGETISVWVNTFNPVDEWVAPAGSVEWTLKFEEKAIESNNVGDTDGDGVINVRDCAKLLQYINGWADVTINAENADVNADGKINTRDYVLLIRYLNGWDVELK